MGALVYLKLRPYRQQSVSHRVCQKLAAKYFGPYRVLARIGNAAYKLDLPAGSRIHPVFHCSHPVDLVGEVEGEPEPLEVLATLYDDAGYLELLVSWVGKPSHENSWIAFRSFEKDFSYFKLEDKLGFKGRSIDKYKRSYFRQRLKKLAEKSDEEGLIEEGELASNKNVQETRKEAEALQLEPVS